MTEGRYTQRTREAFAGLGIDVASYEQLPRQFFERICAAGIGDLFATKQQRAKFHGVFDKIGRRLAEIRSELIQQSTHPLQEQFLFFIQQGLIGGTQPVRVDYFKNLLKWSNGGVSEEDLRTHFDGRKHKLYRRAIELLPHVLLNGVTAEQAKILIIGKGHNQTGISDIKRELAHAIAVGVIYDATGGFKTVQPPIQVQPKVKQRARAVAQILTVPAKVHQRKETAKLLATMKREGFGITEMRRALENSESRDAIQAVVDLNTRQRNKNPDPGF